MSGGLSPSESGLPDSFDEYRLKRLLGAGSMGQVWLAEDTLLERPVAIKVIAAQSPSPVARERFFHEARTLARLSHPNIVAIHRVGVVKGIPYLVSEYVRGTPLDRVDTPVAVPRALAIAVDLARGLAAAHRRGVLHRDLKPANAIEAEEGGVKLLDFGIAELLTGPPPGRALAPAAPSAVRARARPDHDATVTLAGASDAGDIGHAETLGSPSASQDGEAGALAVARAGRNTTRASLQRYLETGEPYAGKATTDTAGNGSIMRLAPVPIRFASMVVDDPNQLAELAAESSLPTHASDQCLSACRYMAVVLAALMHGVDRQEALANCRAIMGMKSPLHPEIEEVADGSYRQKRPPAIRGSGYVVRSLEAALWAFHDAPDFATAVLKAVNLGEDADTTGAVCGQLAGAYWGESGIPTSWLDGLAQRETIVQAANRLIDLSAG